MQDVKFNRVIFFTGSLLCRLLPFEQLIEDLSGVSTSIKSLASLSQNHLDAAGFLNTVRLRIKQEGIQARMPFALEIK